MKALILGMSIILALGTIVFGLFQLLRWLDHGSHGDLMWNLFGIICFLFTSYVLGAGILEMDESGN